MSKREKNPIEEARFEFLLHINDNIICQRYFDIRNYDEKSIYSDDIKDLIDKICSTTNGQYYGLGIIPNHLKKQSMDYLWGYYNPFADVDSNQQTPKKNDVFKFEIKVDKNTVISSEFINDYFTLNQRVSVDIRDIIPEIISEIRETLTTKNRLSISNETKQWLKSIEKVNKDALKKLVSVNQ